MSVRAPPWMSTVAGFVWLICSKKYRRLSDGDPPIGVRGVRLFFCFAYIQTAFNRKLQYSTIFGLRFESFN